MTDRLVKLREHKTKMFGFELVVFVFVDKPQWKDTLPSTGLLDARNQSA